MWGERFPKREAINSPAPGRLIIHPCGMSGGRMQFAPTPGYNYSAYMYQAKFAAHP